MEKYSKPIAKGLVGNSKSALDREIVKVVHKTLRKNQEIKSFDTGFGSSVGNTGTLQKLTTVPQGDTDSERDGDSLRVWKVSCIMSFAFADTTNTGRLLIFRWNQDDSSAAPASITDLLQTASAWSPYNRDNFRAKKFTIFYDRFFVVGATGPNIVSDTWERKVNSNIQFQSGATTGNGHFYSAMISDSAAISHPTFSYVTRAWFTDS